MRYVAGLLLGVGLIVLTFILIFRAFSGDSAPKEQPIKMTDYTTTNVVVRYTVDGRIISDQEHTRVRITVSKDQVMFEQIQGYEGKLTQTKTYPTNVQAFGTFLRALDLAHFSQGNSQVDDDERGYCPSGKRYLYEAVDGGDKLFNWWNTSCSKSLGSFSGDGSTVRKLFESQVPDYSELMRGVKL